MSHPIQSIIPTLRAVEWIPMTAARILSGIFFSNSGATKLLVPARFDLMERTVAQSRIPFPHTTSPLVSLVEFGCGAGLASACSRGCVRYLSRLT
jgi:hypothetical protein